MLFNAHAFQDRLAATNEDVPTVSESLGTGIAGLDHAWREICENIDYVPVIELAAEIVGILGDVTVQTRWVELVESRWIALSLSVSNVD